MKSSKRIGGKKVKTWYAVPQQVTAAELDSVTLTQMHRSVLNSQRNNYIHTMEILVLGYLLPPAERYKKILKSDIAYQEVQS